MLDLIIVLRLVYSVAIFVKREASDVSRMTIATLELKKAEGTASDLTGKPKIGEADLRAQSCTAWETKRRNLDLEAEAKSYVHERFGIVFANWIEAVFLGRFKCIEPEVHWQKDIKLWACTVDAGKHQDRAQWKEMEDRTLEYTQKFMGITFKDFLKNIFSGHIQQGFIDSRTGMMAMLTKPLYLLETIDTDTVAFLAVLVFIEEDPNRPGVFPPKDTKNAQIRSGDTAWFHKPCSTCGHVLTSSTCLKCELNLCKTCRKPCILCQMPVCSFCHQIYRHVCLPQRFVPRNS